LERRDLRAQSIEHEGEFRGRRSTARSRRALETRAWRRRKILQQVLADQRRLANGRRRWIPAQKDVAAKLEVVDQLCGRHEMVADLEVVGVAENVDEPAIPVLFETCGAKGSRLRRHAVDDDAHQRLWIARRYGDSMAK